jgi:hypothetical protein
VTTRFTPASCAIAHVPERASRVSAVVATTAPAAVLESRTERLARIVGVSSGRVVRKWESADRPPPRYVVVIVREMQRSADFYDRMITDSEAA